MNLGRFTYAIWLLGAAAPILGPHWVFWSKVLRPEARAIFGAAALVGTYLCIADGLAIHDRVWEFSPALTLGIRLGPLPLEEVLFFYLTALLVTQSMTLFTYRKSE
jgi:lycopene beta-cyclase